MQLVIEFGVPTAGIKTVEREIPAGGKVPTSFYYENVACTPKGVWGKMNTFLYAIDQQLVELQKLGRILRNKSMNQDLILLNNLGKMCSNSADD